jgi:hypothetical protein
LPETAKNNAKAQRYSIASRIFYAAFTLPALGFRVPGDAAASSDLALETTVDLVYVLATIACFALTLALVRGLELLRKRT